MSRTPINPDLVHHNPEEQVRRIDDTMDRLIEFVPKDLCRAVVYESELQDAFKQRHVILVEEQVSMPPELDRKDMPESVRQAMRAIAREANKLVGKTHGEAFGVFPNPREVTKTAKDVRTLVVIGWLETINFACDTCDNVVGGRLNLTAKLVPDALYKSTHAATKSWHDMPLLSAELEVGKEFAQILYCAFATRLAYAVEKAGADGIPYCCGGDEFRIRKDANGYYVHIIPSK